MNGSMNAAEFGRIEMEVNGIKVTDVKCMNLCCALLRDDPDYASRYKWEPNADGKYEFRTQITDATQYGYARFSSFVLL